MVPNQLLSIIIPVYNTECYLERCLNSLLRQSHQNIELIVVSDGSLGNVKEILEKYMAEDHRVRYISNGENQGLFRTRVIGAEQAKGDFIAFVDSDDYVSRDYYRLLIANGLEYHSDIIIGKTAIEKEDGERFSFNLHNSAFSFDCLEGEEIKDHYFGQRGLCYSWHTIWNKVYTKELWDVCFDYYKKVDIHLIMTEDIAFSTLLFYQAKRVSTVENEAYFYCENKNAATNSEEITIKKFSKNIADMKYVFDFVESYLKVVSAHKNYIEDFKEFRKLYSRLWRTLARNEFLGSSKKQAYLQMDDFLMGYCEYSTEDDHYFSHIKTPWGGGLEQIKERIYDYNGDYISFDLFDTLIQRPFYEPTDLFELLNKKFGEFGKANINFTKLRIDAEAGVRREVRGDVTLKEIYQFLSKHYDLPMDLCSEMMEEEIRLEIRYCRQRKSAKELYEAAICSGKKILITSDMYLEEETIREIMKNTGYCSYFKLFLSSTYRETKHSGHLYQCLIKELGTQGKKILHIGDNYESDIRNSEKYGIEAIHFPKAMDAFKNILGTGRKFDLNSKGAQTMTALVAGKYFDNPFRDFHSGSSFHGDPYLAGYYALGMHIVGILKWLCEEFDKKKIDHIHFLARDGYLIHHGFEQLRKYRPDLPAGYDLYGSRKMLLPFIANEKLDFYDLPVSIRNHTPGTVMVLLDFATSAKENTAFQGILKKQGIGWENKFQSNEQYHLFIQLFLEHVYDPEKHGNHKEMISDYYNVRLEPNSGIFDLGYSGRIPGAISAAVGRGIPTYYIYEQESTASRLSEIWDFEISNFYSYKQPISGIIREYILSDSAPSCIGLRRQGEDVMPIFPKEGTSHNLSAVHLIQKGSSDFVSDFYQLFGDYLPYIPFHGQEVSSVFEEFLNHPSELDLQMFEASYFEDYVYGRKEQEKLSDFWRYNSMEKGSTFGVLSIEHMLINKNKVVKLLLYFIMDRKILVKKIKGKLSTKPRLYGMASSAYTLLKHLKRLIRKR